MRLAIEQDSTAFYKYFLTEILPRYSPLLNSSVLLRIAELFELQNEVEEYLSKIIIVKPSPDKLTTQVNETQNKTRTSPIRKSERISNLVLKNQYKRIQPDRNLQRNISLKKQVKMKKIKSKTPHTPDRGLSGISNCAKRLKEINQTHFYDKKGNQIDDNKEEIEPEDLQVILAVNTPTKETKITQYEPKTYKNLFALYEKPN